MPDYVLYFPCSSWAVLHENRETEVPYRSEYRKQQPPFTIARNH